MNTERRPELRNTQTIVDTLIDNFQGGVIRYPFLTRLAIAGVLAGCVLGIRPDRASADASQSSSAAPSEQAIVIPLSNWNIGVTPESIKKLSETKEEVQANQPDIPDLTKLTVQLAEGTESSSKPMMHQRKNSLVLIKVLQKKESLNLVTMLKFQKMANSSRIGPETGGVPKKEYLKVKILKTLLFLYFTIVILVQSL